MKGVTPIRRRHRAWGLAVLALLLPGCGASDVAPIAPEELARRIAEGSAPLVLDVRSRDEFAAGHVRGAVNVPHSELPHRLDELDVAADTEVVVYCQSGRRAGIASEALAEAGFERVMHLEGHWARWSESDLPSE